MQKIRILQSRLKFFGLTGIFLVLTACGGQKSDQPSARPSLPGMHVYKDPASGEFVAQPPSDRFSPRVMPPAVQQINRPASAKSTSKPAQEYRSSTEGGGILLDLPAPYSDVQK